MPLPAVIVTPSSRAFAVYAPSADHVEAVVGPPGFAVEIERLRHRAVVALEIAAQDGFVEGDVAGIRIGPAETRVASFDGHAALELERGGAIADQHGLARIGLVDALGDPNLIAYLRRIQGILQGPIGVRPTRPVAGADRTLIHVDLRANEVGHERVVRIDHDGGLCRSGVRDASGIHGTAGPAQEMVARQGRGDEIDSGAGAHRKTLCAGVLTLPPGVELMVRER